MRRAASIAFIAMLASLLIACATATPTATVVPPPTVTVRPTATITPYAGVPQPTPALYPTPTTDAKEAPKAPGTLRNKNWPFGTPAIATFSVQPSVDVDISAVVLTVPIPEGATLTFYVAVPPQRGYAGRVSFPVSPRVQALQPGDAIRIVGIAAGTVRVPVTEGTYVVPSINGQRFARNNEPLTG